MITHDPRWSHPRGNTPVPSRWQATAGERMIPDAKPSVARSGLGVSPDAMACGSRLGSQHSQPGLGGSNGRDRRTRHQCGDGS
jgi:hypothetical protein